MEQLFRVVKASERLPEKSIGIPVFGITNHNSFDVFSWDNMMHFFRPYVHESDELKEWLEPIAPIEDKEWIEVEALRLYPVKNFTDISYPFEVTDINEEDRDKWTDGATAYATRTAEQNAEYKELENENEETRIPITEGGQQHTEQEAYELGVDDTVMKMLAWNDVTEKLPEDETEFFDVYDGENVLVMPHAYYKNSGWMPYDSPKVNNKITHYKERPKPPMDEMK